QLGLAGDDEAFDNQTWFAAPELEPITVSYFGLESANDPEKLRYYLQRAFVETPRQRVQLLRPFTNSAFSPEMLNQAAFAVVADKLSPGEATAVRDWLSRGKTALLILT